MDHIIEALTEEIAALKNKLALISMDASNADKEEAEKLFEEQRDEINVLTIELRAIRKSRDEFQAENRVLKRHIEYLRKQIKG